MTKKSLANVCVFAYCQKRKMRAKSGFSFHAPCENRFCALKPGPFTVTGREFFYPESPSIPSLT